MSTLHDSPVEPVIPWPKLAPPRNQTSESMAEFKAEFDQHMKTGALLPAERFWRDHQPWLEERGYMLRPRFHPNWKPSWVSKDLLPRGDEPYPYEHFHDGIPGKSLIMDAMRSDGTQVVLKRYDKPPGAAFEPFFTAFCAQRSDGAHPHNHNTPIYEVLQPPSNENLMFLVLPRLRPCNDPAFDTIGEAVAFFQHLFEGLSYLHSINVAHRDIKYNNVMMDPSGMFPDSFHFVKTDLTPGLKRRAQHFTRTQKPPSYYFIDFGLSGYFPSRPTLEPFILPGDKSVPEHQRFLKARNMRAKSGTGAPPPELQPRDTVADPFSTDVYLLGNLIHSKFILSKRGFEFMELLVTDMRHEDPTQRPSAKEALGRFREIRNYLSTWKLRSRVVERQESRSTRMLRALPHWKRRLGYMARRMQAVPMPPCPPPQAANADPFPLPALASLPPDVYLPIPAAFAAEHERDESQHPIHEGASVMQRRAS